MDIRLFFGVLRRFKLVATSGLLLALGLALLSYVEVDRHGIVTYRTQETWTGQARVLVAAAPNAPFEAAPDTTSLAKLYANLATSDKVQRMAIREHSVAGALLATPGFDKETQTPLPIIVITAISTSPGAAARLANDGVNALGRYVADRQQAMSVPPVHRVHLENLNVATPHGATVASTRSETRPIMVFVLVAAATLGLVLMLENLRPRLREITPEIDRRSA